MYATYKALFDKIFWINYTLSKVDLVARGEIVVFSWLHLFKELYCNPVFVQYEKCFLCCLCSVFTFKLHRL